MILLMLFSLAVGTGVSLASVGDGPVTSQSFSDLTESQPLSVEEIQDRLNHWNRRFTALQEGTPPPSGNIDPLQLLDLELSFIRTDFERLRLGDEKYRDDLDVQLDDALWDLHLYKITRRNSRKTQHSEALDILQGVVIIFP